MLYEPRYYLQKYRRVLIVTGVLCGLAILGFGIYWQYKIAESRQGKLAVPVQVVPSNARVTLSTGEELPSRGEAYIKPGDYKVTVKADGFATQTRELRVSESAAPYIYVGLAGKSADAKKWQENNRRDYDTLEKLTTAKSREYSALFDRNNPIVADLPIHDPYYSVGYRNDGDTSVTLVVWGTSPANRAAALEMLRDKGYEPTDYRIEYDGFENPLGDAL